MFAVVITKNDIIDRYGAVFHHGNRDHGFVLERRSDSSTMMLQTDNDNNACYINIPYDEYVVYAGKIDEDRKRAEDNLKIFY